MDIVSIIIEIIVQVVISAPALWIAGRWRIGANRARFMDAVWITALGVVVQVITAVFIGGGIGSIAQLVIYLYLVKQYYETDWVNAAIIAVLAVVILFVVGRVLAMAGFALIGPGLIELVAVL